MITHAKRALTMMKDGAALLLAANSDERVIVGTQATCEVSADVVRELIDNQWVVFRANFDTKYDRFVITHAGRRKLLALQFVPVLSRFQGAHAVDVRLSNTASNERVFWSEQGNSYVIVTADRSVPGCMSHTWVGTVRDPMVKNPCNIPGIQDRWEYVYIVSTNGIGEVRWFVPHSGSTAGDLDAAAYFNLKPAEMHK